MTEEEQNGLVSAMRQACWFKQGEILQLKTALDGNTRYQVLTQQAERHDGHIRLMYMCRASVNGLIQGPPIMVLEEELEHIREPEDIRGEKEE